MSIEGSTAVPQPQPHAVVSGSSSGIGRAIAMALLDAGWQVSGLDAAPASIVHAAFTGHAGYRCQDSVRHDIDRNYIDSDIGIRRKIG